MSFHVRVTGSPVLAVAEHTVSATSAPEVAAETSAVRPVLSARQETAPGSVVPDRKQIHTAAEGAWPVYVAVNMPPLNRLFGVIVTEIGTFVRITSPVSVWRASPAEMQARARICV